MPTDCGPISYSNYLNTLGDLEGFTECHNCGGVIVAGDFNVILIVVGKILNCWRIL